VGSVTPFGNLLNIDSFFDEEIGKKGEVIFSCGLRTESIVMKSKDLMRLVDPKIAKLSQD